MYTYKSCTQTISREKVMFRKITSWGGWRRQWTRHHPQNFSNNTIWKLSSSSWSGLRLSGHGNGGVIVGSMMTVMMVTMMSVGAASNNSVIVCEREKKSDDNDDDNDKYDSWVNEMKKDASQWWKEWNDSSNHAGTGTIGDGKNKNKNRNRNMKEDGDDGKKSNSKDGFQWDGFMKDVTSMIRGDVSEEELKHLIESATKATKSGGNNKRAMDDWSDENNMSLLEISSMIRTNLEEISKVLTHHFSHLDVINKLDPTAILYFLELEDQRKNPSWKRFMHRYHSNVNVEQLRQLNRDLSLAELSYADDVQQIRKQLDQQGYELLFCETQSLPAQPSHFLALKKNQSKYWNDSLEVLMVVRGTKSVPDMLTDAFLDATPYRQGYAHAGILRAGTYLANKHLDLLRNINKQLFNGQKNIHVTLIGHSLGAGAATIAAMELTDKKDFTATVTGFGCPAMLSKDLSDAIQPYVTTVIADADVIPRMSSATIANTVLDIMEYDWTPKGKRDIKQALEQIIHPGSKLSILFGANTDNAIITKIMSLVNQAMEQYVHIPPQTTQRISPILYPPGSCVHFYRDGVGISGAISPCAFFGTIDVSRTMIHDHLIGKGYRRIFLEIMRHHLDDAHFSFDPKPSTNNTNQNQ